MTKIKLSDLDKTFFKLDINWAYVLAFVVFWCYGYFGSFFSKNLSLFLNIIISVILYSIFIIFLFLGHSQPAFKDSILLTKKDILTFSSYFFIMFVISFEDLMVSLSGDQLAHSWYSQAHAIQAILRLSKFIFLLRNLAFSNVLYLVNILMLISGFCIFHFLRKKRFYIKTVYLSILFVVFRMSIISFNGYADIHPAFRLFPLWLSSSILSSSNISFRLPQFLGLICFMWLAQRIARDELSLWPAWFFGLCVGTIPILWHVGILAEQSVWSAIIWSLFLLSFSRCESLDKIKWIRWFSLISIFSLMRQPAFIGLIPLGFLLFISVLKNKTLKNKDILLAVLPILAMTPFLINRLIFENPVTNSINLADYGIPVDASAVQRVWIALSSGLAYKIILDSLMLPWFIFLLFALFPLSCKSNRNIKAMAVFLFFISAFFVFYSITPSHWVVGRYKAEYIVPFVILGFFNVLVKLNEVTKSAFKFMIVGLLFLFCFNTYIFKNLYLLNGPNIVLENLYRYDKALKAVRQEGFADSTVIAGSAYGVLPQIMNGFTVSQVSSSFDIYKQIVRPLAVIDYRYLKNNEKIKLILISDMPTVNRKELVSFLLSKGWSSWKNFKYNRSSTVIYGFINPD